MKKIGIITCLDLNNVNYGNRLQAFALNRYLCNEYGDDQVETVLFDRIRDYKKTRKQSLPERIVKKIRRELLKLKGQKGLSPLVNGRLEACNDFTRSTTKLTDQPVATMDALKKLSYETMITGSDVVWYQWKGEIRRTRFLDFETDNGFRKVAYAASLGRNWIPEENRSEVVRCLKDFDRISVRENSTVAYLEQLGIENVQNTVDSTLLLTKEEWEALEKRPAQVEETDQYIFVYLLGGDKKDRETIGTLAVESGLKIVSVPLASGNLKNEDREFGDIRVMDCSPQEWVWLIHHAQYVITDSFHGMVFSTIFGTKFLLTRRKEKYDINQRLQDYIELIGQQDKYVRLDSIDSLETLSWDFDSMHRRIDTKAAKSRAFLREAIGEPV